MRKVNKSKITSVTKLIRSQLEGGITAALTGDSFERVAAGINVQKNLKVLARMCLRNKLGEGPPPLEN